MRLIDVNGNPHPMTKFQVRMMIMIGWLAFLLAGLMNILFYKVHPSFVDFDPKRLKEKCFIYLFGRKIVFFASRKGIFTLYHYSFTCLIEYIWSYLDNHLDPENLKVKFTKKFNTPTSDDDNDEEQKELIEIPYWGQISNFNTICKYLVFVPKSFIFVYIFHMYISHKNKVSNSKRLHDLCVPVCQI